MASGSGNNQYIQTKVAVNLPREEWNAAAAATKLPLPAPPSESSQERFYGAPEAGGQSPSTTTAVEAAAGAKNSKETVYPSRRGSAGGKPPLFMRATCVSGSRELRSAGGKAPLSPRPMSHAEVAASGMLVTPKWTRRNMRIDMKGEFNNLMMEFEITREMDQKAEVDELPSQMMQQVKTPTLWPGKVNKKSLWRKTVHISGILRNYKLFHMVAGQGAKFGSNALNFCCAYSEFRQVHGDGECFYRSFIFSYLEQVLDRQDTHEEQCLLAVKGVCRQHARLGRASFSRSHKVFKKLIQKFIRSKAHIKWKPESTTKSYGIVEPFSSYDSANEIFTVLRLVAAIWRCSHSEEFESLLPAVSDGCNLIDWCFDEAIHRKVFTDHVKIKALVSLLGLLLRVEEAGQDLNSGQNSPVDMARSTSSPCYAHLQPHNHGVPSLTLLYTNEQYDAIYPDERCCEQMTQVFKKLIQKFIRSKAHIKWKPESTTKSYGIVEPFSSYDSTNEIFTVLRLVAAIWRCSHSEEFESLLPAVSDGCNLIDKPDSRSIYRSSLKQWCFDEAIHRKVFTDHVQIKALVSLLRVLLRVEEAGKYLHSGQNSLVDMAISTSSPCYAHLQPHNHGVPSLTLLYTNEQYDTIYRDERSREQTTQFKKRRDRTKAVQALVPTSIGNGSYISTMVAIVRLGWLVFLSVCNSVLCWIATCCFCKRQRPDAPSPEYSWLSVMGSPIINSDSSCAISACTMCIEAQHRLVFERLNGKGSFTFKAKVPAELKKSCYKTGDWNSQKGAKLEEILIVIAEKGGILTQRVPNNIRLPIDGFFTIDINDIGGYQLMRIIYAQGPIIGSLWAANGYYDKITGDNVYRRVRDEYKTSNNGDHHAVVCFGYKFDKRVNELHIRIMDNHTNEGPLRWIDFSAFDYFVVPLVTKRVESYQLCKKRKKDNGSMKERSPTGFLN